MDVYTLAFPAYRQIVSVHVTSMGMVFPDLHACTHAPGWRSTTLATGHRDGAMRGRR